MGFLFRLCFWLGVAALIMPPEDRPGQAQLGQAGAGVQTENVEDRLRIAVYSAWAFASEVASACETNPKLCEATRALATTTAETGHALVMQVQETLASGGTKVAALPEQDGRVDKFQGRAD